MIPFNYHHLYYFYTIAKNGSISRACEELKLAQPTLSAQLKQFENSLNLKLFEREGRNLRLTETGKHVLSFAAEIFDTGKELMDGLGGLTRKGRLRIRIGISTFVPRSVVDALLKFLLKIEPDIYLFVEESKMNEVLKNLKSHDLDLVLTDTPAHFPTEGIENHLIAEIPIVFCAHASISGKIKKIPDDLNAAPMILPTAQSQVYQAVQEYFIAHRIKPNIVAEIQDVELVRRLVLAGIGIAPLNAITVKQAPTKEPLSILDKKTKLGIYDKIYLLTKERKKENILIQKIIDQFKLI
jgi:LysR family transcriptional regulator, transcriptional activator of nhaA